MKRLATAAALLLLATAGCENEKSKLDGMKGAPSPTAEAPAAVKVDRTGSVEDRLARLEDNWAKHAEALDFLNKVYAQQKAQQEQQKREEHDPNAVFAVNIDQNVKLGLVEGPNTATVTIVEAFDFA